MDSNTFDGLMGYKSAMAQARVMKAKGLMNAEEVSIIETKLCEIYGINFGSVYRDIDWITTPFRGNMGAVKEVV